MPTNTNHSLGLAEVAETKIMRTQNRSSSLLARTMITLVLTAIQGLAQSVYTPYTFSTIAGQAGSPGNADGQGSTARFRIPASLVVDSANNIYVADTYNHTIRKITPVGTNWVVTTLAGRAGYASTMDGTNSAALFNAPTGIVVDRAGNVYTGEWGGHTIRKLTPVGTNWVVTTLAGQAGSAGSTDGTNSTALFNEPSGLAVDSTGNLYMSDFNNNNIRKITPVGTNWVVTTLAGRVRSAGSTDGTNNAALFNAPSGVKVDSAGNLYVSEYNNRTIRKISPMGTNWVVTTLAGRASSAGSTDGTNSTALFNAPTDLAIDSAGNLYVCDFNSHNIRKITPLGTNWVVTTLAGRAGAGGSADGTGSAARFYQPQGIAVDSAGNVYVADTTNHTIRRGCPVSLVIVASGPGFGFSNGQFGFSLTGPTGQSVVIEASTDFVSWQPLWTNIFAGTLNFSDPRSSDYSHRFYRARTP